MICWSFFIFRLFILSGQPNITMVGAAGDVNVKAEPVGVGVYQCSYTPEACGEALEFLLFTSENQFIRR